MASKPAPPVRVLEFYSGIGGMHYALGLAGLEVPAKVLTAFDINTVANEIYRHNFKGVKVVQRLIESIPAATFEKFKADLWTMSPPCQPFTRTGNQQHSDDPRSRSFLFLTGLLAKMECPPRYILLENVKGFDESATRDGFVKVLDDRGYTYEEYLLSPEQVGIPNSRLRYYLLAELGGRFAASSDVSSTLPTAAAAAAAAVTCNPQAHRITSSMDLPRYPVNAIADYLEQALLVNPEQAKPHFLDARTLCRLTRIMDIVNAESRRSMCFTKGYGHFAEGTGSVLQLMPTEDPNAFHDHEQWAGWEERCQCRECYSEREAKKRLTAMTQRSRIADGEAAPTSSPAETPAARPPRHKPPIHAAGECPLAAVLELRYFSPREISRLMGFPEAFKFPAQSTLKQCRNVLGNSLNVQVVGVLMTHLLKTHKAGASPSPAAARQQRRSIAEDRSELVGDSDGPMEGPD